MQKTAPHSVNSESEIKTSELTRYADYWLNDSRIRQLSPRTVEERKGFVQKLLWFLNDKGYENCGVKALREFLAYLGTAHQDSSGRWGNSRMSRPLRPITVRTYYVQCRVLFNWLVAEEYLEDSPMKRIKAPVARPDQVQPFTAEQINALINAAKKSKHPRRDEALILFMLDSGCRASEICSLRMRDLNLPGQCCTVLGKGNKRRVVYFGQRTAKALRRYLRENERVADAPVFYADRGTRAGEALTRSGLLQMMKRLSGAAGVEGTRCSPHTFRHTFAVSFLRNGGNLFTLQQLLGHTTVTMSQKYVALAQADLECQHRQYSPGDWLGRSVR